MNFQTVEQARLVAKVLPTEALPSMSYSQRLERWALALEQHKDGALQPLRGTEYEPGKVRKTLRIADSPLSIAFEDPLLCAHGLRDDTYGEALRFFSVSDGTLHRIVCHCYYATPTISSAEAAIVIRRAARRAHRIERAVAALHLGGTRFEVALCRIFV